MQIVETFGSGSLSRGANRSGERQYLITGVADPPTSTTDAAVASFVESNSDTTFDGMARRGIAVEQVAPAIWRATVSYTPSELRPPSEYEGFLTTFSTNGGSETVLLARSQRRMALDSPVASDAIDHGLQIGVTESGDVEGVQIVVPRFEFNETHYFPRSAMTPGYVETLAFMTGSVNQFQFRNFAAETVLFMGASGALRAAEQDWELTFSFSCSPNRTLSVGDLIGDPQNPFATNTIEKRGHDYLWLAYQKELTAQTNEYGRVSVRPIAAYVAQVYPRADFRFLQIGGHTGGSTEG
jgi:hypothetical protein